jgi:hypothetical protein
LRDFGAVGLAGQKKFPARGSSRSLPRVPMVFNDLKEQRQSYQPLPM